jgi:hypothetical protein
MRKRLLKAYGDNETLVLARAVEIAEELLREGRREEAHAYLKDHVLPALEKRARAAAGRDRRGLHLIVDQEGRREA